MNRIPIANNVTIPLAFLDEAKFLEKNEIQTIIERPFTVTRYISQGSTCLVYEGYILDSAGNKERPVIVKEFYPAVKEENLNSDHGRTNFYAVGTPYIAEMPLISRNSKDHRLELHDSSDEGYNQRFLQFIQSYKNQKRYALHEKYRSLTEYFVKPLDFAIANYGDSYYICYDVNPGSSLEKTMNALPLNERAALLKSIAEVLAAFEKEDLLFLDLRPENILAIHQGDQLYRKIYLFDSDSIIAKDRIREGIYFNDSYISPTMRRIVNHMDSFQSNYSTITHKSVLYSFGVLMYHILFGHLPKENGWKREDMINELVDGGKGYSRKIAEKFADILQKIHPKEDSQITWNAAKVEDELSKLIKDMDGGINIVSREESTERDYLFVAYDLLDRYPLYQYPSLTQDKTYHNAYDMEVCIFGRHTLRTYLFQAIISCAQMSMPSHLKLWICAEDAQDMLDTILKDYPAIRHAVNFSMDGKSLSENDIDDTLVSRPLADVSFVTIDSEEDIPENITEKCRYYLFTDWMSDKNEKRAAHLVEKVSGQCFVGLISGEKAINNLINRCSEKCQIFQLETPDNSLFIAQKIMKSGLLEQAVFVDSYYQGGLGINPDYNKIYRKLLNDPYSLNSSERCVVHLKYALASVGIRDILDISVFSQLATQLSDRNVILELSDLEHLSWSAYMILTGWQRLTMDEYDRVAFKGKNKWKDEEGHRHPYLCSSRPERNLYPDSWKLPEADPSWDELDRVSYEMHKINCRHVKEKEVRLKKDLENLDRRFKMIGFEGNDTLVETLQKQLSDFYDTWHLDKAGWNDAIEKLEEKCSRIKEAGYALNMPLQLKNVSALFGEASVPRNVKTTDEDLIYASTALIGYSMVMALRSGERE